MENAPQTIEEEKTAPVPRQTNRELVYGYINGGDDDRFADDAEFGELVRWDGEALR